MRSSGCNAPGPGSKTKRTGIKYKGGREEKKLPLSWSVSSFFSLFQSCLTRPRGHIFLLIFLQHDEVCCGDLGIGLRIDLKEATVFVVVRARRPGRTLKADVLDRLCFQMDRTPKTQSQQQKNQARSQLHQNKNLANLAKGV